MSTITLTASLRNWPCQNRAIHRLFEVKVISAGAVVLPLSEIIDLVKTTDLAKGRRTLSLSPVMEGSQKILHRRGDKMILDVPALKEGEENDQLYYLSIDRKVLQAELMARRNDLHVGMKLYFNLLQVDVLQPDRIEIGQAPPRQKEPRPLDTLDNLLKGTPGLTTDKIPHESIKEMLDRDLEKVIKVLAEDHPAYVKKAIATGKFAPVLMRQNRSCLINLLKILSAGIAKLDAIFKSGDLRTLYPFLPLDFTKKIAEIFSRNNRIVMSGEYCQHIGRWYHRLPAADRAEVDEILSDARAIVVSILDRAKYEIAQRMERSPKDLMDTVVASETKIRDLILSLYRSNLFEVLLPTYVDAVALTISESRRKKIILDIRQSNFIPIVKELLCRILDEKKAVRIAMYSFTSPLFAAACFATALRGAAVKILLDPSEAMQKSSQYKNFCERPESLFQKFDCRVPLEVRIFRGTQHLKNILLGTVPTVTSGSLNITENGLTRQLEDITLFDSASLYEKKAQRFDSVFAMSGSYVPFPEALTDIPWIQRSGIAGISLPGKPPYPSEIASIFHAFSRVRSADFGKIPALFALLHEKGAKLVIDLSRSFANFMAVLQNPDIVKALLPSFLAEVPAGFSFSAASSGGKLHPGTTSGLAGLIEHENITCELAVKFCRILGREDLVEPAILATIAHDTYKNANDDGHGGLSWGRYNPSHGQLAAQKLQETYRTHLEPQKRSALDPMMDEVLKAVGEHMSIFNAPAPTPLTADDPILKYVMVLADMLASRKYLYVRHRAGIPMDNEEIMHLLLNNSFSIEGEGLDRIKTDAPIFGFLQDAFKACKLSVNGYSDLPGRTKQVLRIAESLCDLFPDYKEVFVKRGAEITPEETERQKRRNEILSAAILYGTVRYTWGIDDPNSKKEFDRIIGALVQKYPDPESRERKILNLAVGMDQKLKSPKEAPLLPADAPAYWILCMANCLMTAEDVWIVTLDDVEYHLKSAQPPRTLWARKKYDPAVEKKLASDIRDLTATDFISEYLPFLEAGLLGRFNARRKVRTISRTKLLRNYPEAKEHLRLLFRNPEDEIMIYKSNFKAAVAANIGNELLQEELLKTWEKSNEDVPLKKIPPEVLSALVKKYGSLSVEYIFEHFYSSRERAGREEIFEKLVDASKSPEAARALAEEIGNLTAPEEKGISAIYRLAARTFLANDIASVERVRQSIASAGDAGSISDYSYFKHINTAVDFISGKLNDPAERILVYGDYDVDGLTSTALLVKTLRWIRAKSLSKQMDSKKAQEMAAASIGYYIPNRLTEGYGLNADALQRIERYGFRTVITADCGIRSRQLVRLGKKMGLNFVITDHHDYEAKELPRSAVAVINPKVDLDPRHPAYGLVGAAVAYKLAKALADRAGIDLRDSFLDSVALASIADIVPMTGETRAFVKAGLKRMNSGKRNRGLSAIAKAARLERIDEESLAFFVAPILNVAGRFGNAYKSLALLMPRSEKEVTPALSELFALSEDRRECEEAILRDAESGLDFDPAKHSGIAVAGEWHKGVIGLVASKLVHRYGVPAAIIALPSSSYASPAEPASGSMRSIKGISARRILKLCADRYRKEKNDDLFLDYGGHAGAAGFKIGQEKIDDFKKIYDEVTRAFVKTRREKMIIAGTMTEADINLEDVKLLKQILSPFGSGFEEPRFLIAAGIKSWQVFGKDHQHLKGILEGGTPFIFFNGNQPWIKRILIRKKAQFVVKLGVNVYKGKESVQLIVEDLKGAKE